MSHTPFIPLLCRRHVVACVAVTLALSLAVSCAPRYAPRIIEGGELTMNEAVSLGRSADISTVEDVKAEEAAQVRSLALVALRREGGEEAGELADLLTRDFPADARSVPVLVEKATVDGVPVWVVVEAWGGRGDKLTHRRVWVFSRNEGRLLRSASFR